MTRRIIICLVGSVIAAASQVPSFDPASYLAHIRYLASPEMRGRANGSPELERAAAYIAAQFRADGLQAMNGGYPEAFGIVTSSKLGKHNGFESIISGETETLQLNKEFVPYDFSASGKAAGQVVFAGYGITAPEYHYDDYAGIDVRGKLVVVLAHEPQEFDDASVFAGRVYTAHAEAYRKALNARDHGAAGVILVLDRVNHPGASDELPPFDKRRGPADAHIPFVQVAETVIDAWMRAAGKDLPATEAAINADLKPRSFALPGVEVRENIDVQQVAATIHNVIGYLPGETPDYIIVGAHYDHLGTGEQFSLAPALVGTIHPGADDNASGTAGVLELARYFQTAPKPKRGILFIAFAGEELGLLGSGYYADHPVLPLSHAVAILNMDMIGRMRDDKLYIGGVTSGAAFRADLDELTSGTAFRLDYSERGYGSSDHVSFLAKQIPSLLFFTGLHANYHRPGDTWDKIDAPAATRILQLIAGMLMKLEQ